MCHLYNKSYNHEVFLYILSTGVELAMWFTQRISYANHVYLHLYTTASTQINCNICQFTLIWDISVVKWLWFTIS